MFEIVLISVGALVALSAIWASMRPMPKADPFYV